MSTSRDQLLEWLNKTLRPELFADYCPNGLQVEGKQTVQRIITGVTASQALLDAALQHDADTVIVHHGWFWRGEDPTIRGVRRTRLATALNNDINVIAYHLPLDAHPAYGNNAQLARVLNLEPSQDEAGHPVTGGEKGLVWFGSPRDKNFQLSGFVDHISKCLGREVICVGEQAKSIRTVAWCTGAAQGMFDVAIHAQVDAYITGEISEPNAHLARESGVAFISAGHHATERYGVRALGEALARHFDIEVTFLDLDNPA